MTWRSFLTVPPTSSQSVGGQSAAEKRKQRTGSWALRGQVHFYPNGASRFDVMRTRNDLIRNCQFSLNFISPVSPLTASFLFFSLTLVLCCFLILIFRDLKCHILIRDAPSECTSIKKSCFCNTTIIFHWIQFLFMFSLNHCCYVSCLLVF